MHTKRRFKVDKLVRDKMSSNLFESKVTLHERIMESAEYATRLKNKILEEAQEVCEATTPVEIQEELADLLEVIHALGAFYDLSYENIEQARILKKNKAGGFEGRRYSEFIEYDANDPTLQYCLDHPDKYPEIIS